MFKRTVMLALLGVAIGGFNHLEKSELPWKKGICFSEMQEHPPNFQPEKFFRGRWYEGQTFGTFFSDVYRKCITLEATIVNSAVNLTLYEYIPVIFSTISQQVEITLDPETPTRFNVVIPWLGMTVITLPVNIIATDYDNYAVLYSCSPALGLDGYVSESGFVFRRKRGDKSLAHEIRDIAWRNGIKYEDFVEADNDKCPKDS